MTDDFVLNELKDLRRQVEELVTDDKGEAAINDAIFSFPALVGFWPMSAIGESKQANDLTGNGLQLTRNGTQNYNIDNKVALSRYPISGTSYHSRATQTIFDITGNESAIKSEIRGITIGCWVRTRDTTIGGNQYVMAKRGGGGGDSYSIRMKSTDVITFRLTEDTTLTVTEIDSTSVVVQDEWAFICGKLNTSTNIVTVFINGEKTTASATLGNGIDTSTSDFTIAAISGGTQLLDGDVSKAFLCACDVPDGMINDFYELSRPLFGV